MSASFSFTEGTAIIGTISSAVDASGAPATFKSPPTWSSSDTSTFNPVVASDGLSCTGTMLKTGSVTITVIGDGITETAVLTGVAGSVVSFQLNFAPAPPAPPAGA
jgi:hypothetical protein